MGESDAVPIGLAVCAMAFLALGGYTMRGRAGPPNTSKALASAGYVLTCCAILALKFIE